MERIDSNPRLSELYGGPGFIYNDFGGPNQSKSNMDFNVLHRADCRDCDPARDKNAMTVKTTGQKLFFETFREAVGWLLENRPGNYRKCSNCNPR